MFSYIKVYHKKRLLFKKATNQIWSFEKKRNQGSKLFYSGQMESLFFLRKIKNTDLYIVFVLQNEQQMAKDFVKAVENAEQEYQVSV